MSSSTFPKFLNFLEVRWMFSENSFLSLVAVDDCKSEVGMSSTYFIVEQIW